MDSSTTIGDLATYLVRADPQTSELHGLSECDLTLTLVGQGNRVLDPRSTVPESGLRAGARVVVTRRNERVVDAGCAVAVASVVAGPDSGQEFPLWRGAAYIGRAHDCEIRVSDSSVSRRHARLVLAGPPELPEVVDLGSANGLSIGGVQVPRTVLAAGDRLRLGDTVVEVRLLAGDSDPAGVDPASVAFSRSPRIAPLFEGREFELPELPERPKPSRIPWLAMLFPVFMGVGLFALTRSPYSLMFVLMSPMMMLGNHVEQARLSRGSRDRAGGDS